MRSINFDADPFEPFAGKTARGIAGGALSFGQFEFHQACR
jgi:hypothetical protein